MSRRLTTIEKINRAIEGVGRAQAMKALILALESLITAEIAQIYAIDEDDIDLTALLARAADLYRIDPARIRGALAADIAAYRERLALRADPDAIATLATPRDLGDEILAALAAIGGAACA